MGKKRGLVFNVGINDNEGLHREKNKIIKSYDTWNSMIRRCYSEKALLRRPTYIGCTVCDKWLLFSNFKKWFDEHYKEGMHLDKDILIEGNKVYSPDTCRFVPQYLNSLLNDNKNARGELPLGVTKIKGSLQVNPTYMASCSNGYGKSS